MKIDIFNSIKKFFSHAKFETLKKEAKIASRR